MFLHNKVEDYFDIDHEPIDDEVEGYFDDETNEDETDDDETDDECLYEIIKQFIILTSQKY